MTDLFPHEDECVPFSVCVFTRKADVSGSSEEVDL